MRINERTRHFLLKLKKYIKHKINQHILFMLSNHPTKAIQNIYIYFKEETRIGTSKIHSIRHELLHYMHTNDRPDGQLAAVL